MNQESGSAADAAWSGVLDGEGKARLEALLPDYLLGRRWFSAKARTIARAGIAGAVPFSPQPGGPPEAYITFVRVEYAEGDDQTFVLPLALATGDAAARLQETMPQALVALVGEDGGGPRLLYDASWNPDFGLALLEAIRQDRRFGGTAFEIHASPTPVFEQLAAGAEAPLTPRVVGAEQSNTSIIYGGRFILKLFRRLEQGTSPDLEIGRFLTDCGFANTPPMAGALERQRADDEPITLAILQGFVHNKGDAWSYTLDELAGYFERAAGQADAPELPRGQHILDLAGQQMPAQVRQALGSYLESARLLGRRTSEMHLALASGTGDPAFAPEPLTEQDQRALYEAVQRSVAHAFGLLAGRIDSLSGETRQQADAVVALREGIMPRFQPLLERQIAAQRTRVHGDYHLGQVLWTGEDFMIIDFEGEPIRSLEERRLKHSPLKDVAGMLRSFHYAAYAAMFARPEDTTGDSNVERWTDSWHQWVSAAFLDEYLSAASRGSFLPTSRDDLQVLLDAYLLDKAIYELNYELNNRPDWLRIPLQGIRQLAS